MDLGAQMEGLAEQIVASRAARSQMAAERVESVSVLRIATQQQVQAFWTERADTAAVMRTELASGVRQRHDEVRRLLDGASQQLSDAGRVRRAEAHAAVAERARLVKGTLLNWDAARRRAGHQLMQALRVDRIAATKAMHKELDEFREGLAESVRARLSESHNERIRAARAWASLSASAGPAVAPEQFSATIDAVDQQSAEDDVQARILAYVNAHPEGVRLTDITAALELARVHAGKLTRQLVDDNQIRKDDLLYLPAVRGELRVETSTEH